MSPQAAERLVVATMRLLALGFAVAGTLLIATPDGVIGAIDDLGDAIGSFADGAETEQKFWLALGFAYMVVITGIALVVSSDVVRFRPLLLVLAAGKAASSLAALAFYVGDDDVFIYLLNFLVDGTLVLTALWCWSLVGRVQAARPAAAAPG